MMDGLKSLKNIGLFLKALWQQPRRMGAVAPSSPYLAEAMVKPINGNSADYVIEIGAGTGAITGALLQHGVSIEKLIVVESSEELSQHLIETYPGLKVLTGNATNLLELLPAEIKPIQAIVSSLPLRSMEPEEVDKVLHVIHKLLPFDGKFIQFTYNLRGNNTALMKKFKLIYKKYVWLNLPPACVLVFKPRD